MTREPDERELVMRPMEFTALYVSADRRRTMSEPVAAPDIDAATSYAIENLEGPSFGAGSAWFVAAVVQTDVLELAHAALEHEL